MKKNAGIKSKKEAAQRLIDGEVFYHNGHSLKFDNQWVNPFRTIYGLNNTKIDDEWSYFDNWETEIDWRENIGKGVLCWVWNEIEYKTFVFDLLKNANRHLVADLGEQKVKELIAS